MVEIVQEGPTEYEGRITCHVCDTVFIARTEDLGIGGFKENPDTYWFDGSATSVDKYYVMCPHGCGSIFIPNGHIPELAKRKAVRDLRWQEGKIAEGRPR